MNVGIVAEGKSDFFVLKRYIEEWGKSYVPGEPVIVQSYQPTVDATSGKSGKGGWTLVKVWCENNPPSTRQNQIFKPLFRHEDPCDALVIHLDGDIVGEFVDATPGVALPGGVLNKINRAIIVNSVIEKWLWPNGNLKTVAYSYDQHIKLPAIRTMEAWIVAGLDENIADPEEIEAKSELMRLKPELTVTKDGHVQLKISGKKWLGLAETTAEKLNHIRAKCDQLDLCLSRLEAI